MHQACINHHFRNSLQLILTGSRCRQKQRWVLDKKRDGSDNGTADMTVCSLHYRKKAKADNCFKGNPNDQIVLSNYCSSTTEYDNKIDTLIALNSLKSLNVFWMRSQFKDVC